MMFQEKMIQSGTLLDKANELMEEQDDEIKKLNEVCLINLGITMKCLIDQA